nr:tetratricopeptide repeat protein [Trichocoleus sp. FACHB-46]
MHQALQRTDRIVISAIEGMGGVGKTELAIQYAQRYIAEYSGGICWLQAREGKLDAQILQLAELDLGLKVRQEWRGQSLTTEEQVAWCWRNWQPPEGLVLLVLDDVTNWGECHPVLPKNLSRFRVLVTTRQRLQGTFFELALDVLPQPIALELLKSLVEDAGQIERERETAERLCQWLGNLPLGLQLVGIYLKQDPDLSLATMLERLKRQRLKHEAIDLEAQPEQEAPFVTAQRGVRAAFELSWQELDEFTANVGRLLSLFAPEVIPWKLVELAAQNLAWDESALETSRRQLYSHYLIQREGLGIYRVHPLIREFLQDKLEGSEQVQALQQAFAAAMVTIAQQISNSSTSQNIHSFSVAIPHLIETTQNWIAAVKDEDLVWPFRGIAQFYERQGLYALAEPYYQQCLAVVKKRLGDEHYVVAISLNNLALLYYSQGRYIDAESLNQQALKLRGYLFEDKHPDVAQSLNNLALVYKAQGRYSDAEPLLVQALELNKHLLGEEHPVVVASLGNLGSLYYSQGRYRQAEPLLVQALELHKHLLGEDHLNVAASLNNLALLYKAQGQYNKAEPLYQQGLELSKRLLGEDHPDVAQSINNLGSFYYSQGRYNKAEPLYQQGLELSKRLLGEDHPDVATSINNLAALYLYQGQHNEAEPLFLQGLKMRQDLLGDKHPDVATSLNNLALLRCFQERYGEAKQLYEQALEIAEQSLGKNHPNTVVFRKNLDDVQIVIASQQQTSTSEPQA